MLKITMQEKSRNVKMRNLNAFLYLKIAQSERREHAVVVVGMVCGVHEFFIMCQKRYTQSLRCDRNGVGIKCKPSVKWKRK